MPKKRVKTKHRIIALRTEMDTLFVKFRKNCPDHAEAEHGHTCSERKLIPSMEPSVCTLDVCPRIERAKQGGGERSA